MIKTMLGRSEALARAERGLKAASVSTALTTIANTVTVRCRSCGTVRDRSMVSSLGGMRRLWWTPAGRHRNAVVRRLAVGVMDVFVTMPQNDVGFSIFSRRAKVNSSRLLDERRWCLSILTPSEDQAKRRIGGLRPLNRIVKLCRFAVRVAV